MRFSPFVFCAVLACSAAANADTLYSTGFEAPGFVVGQLAGQGGFGQSVVGQVQNTVSYAGSQAVVFNATGTPGQNLTALGFSFTPTSTDNIVTLQMMAMFTSAPNQSAFDVFAGYSSAGYVDQLLYVDGKAYVGGGSGQTAGLAVALDTWNTYALAFDYTTQTATGYVNGTTIGSQAFATASADFTGLAMGINFNQNGTNSAYYDNLSVFTNGTALTPEPSSLLLLGTGVLGLAAAARRRLRVG